MTEEDPLTSKRWHYAKRLADDGTTIIALLRTRALDIQYLRQGRWVIAHYKDWFTIREDPFCEWLTIQERRNLLSYLACGQKELPRRLDLEPSERYRKWICPNCRTRTVVPIVIGLPSYEDMKAATEGHIILYGCVVHGDEPQRPVACTTCDWHGEHVKGTKVTMSQAPKSSNESD